MNTRRDFLKSAAAVAGVPVATTLGLSATVLGADEAPRNNGEYQLPKLPYAYEALEPYIDAKTMRIHHSKHHAGYTKGLNKTLAKLEAARNDGDFANIQALSRALSFHAGGYINHIIFWNNMAPKTQGGGADIPSALATRLENDFGSVDKMKSHFTNAALKVEGNGWGVLGYHPMLRRLMVTQMMNQQDLNTIGLVPILMIDVWEHAYYVHYQNKRGDYIKNWWNVVNWADVAQRYNKLTAV